MTNQKQEIWIKPNTNIEYKQVEHFSGKFMLLRCNGSLSSTKTYESKEEAIKEGWRLK
jgi:hypothetical protein